MWGVLPPPLKRVVVATMVVVVAAGERPWFRSSGEVLVSVERGEGWPGLFRVSPFLNSFGEGDGDDDGDGEIVRLLAAALRSPLASLPAVLLYFICTCVVPSRSFPLRKSGKSSSLVGGECTWVEKKKAVIHVASVCHDNCVCDKQQNFFAMRCANGQHWCTGMQAWPLSKRVRWE